MIITVRILVTPTFLLLLGQTVPLYNNERKNLINKYFREFLTIITIFSRKRN